MMKLIKLYSDNPKFRSIHFNEGLSVIVGLKKSTDKNKSSNGIGKSMSLSLIHLILGASFSSNTSGKKLKKFLANYGTFFLHIQDKDGIERIFKKNFSQKEYYIDGVKYVESSASKDYTNQLKSLLVSDHNNRFNMSFRQLFNCFARRYIDSNIYYKSATFQQAQGEYDHSQMITNLSLLDVLFDEHYVYKSLKDSHAVLTNTKKQLINYIDDNEEQINQYHVEIARLKDAKQSFKISPIYSELQEQADELTYEINDLRNAVSSNERTLRKNKTALKHLKSENVDFSTVNQLYQEAQIFFPECVKERVESAQKFHVKLYNFRKERIHKSIEQGSEQLKRDKDHLKKLAVERDHLLESLSRSGALDEYSRLIERISLLEKEVVSLSSNKVAHDKIEQDILHIEQDISTRKVSARDSLDDLKEHIQFSNLEFNKLVSQFYGDRWDCKLDITFREKTKFLYYVDTYIKKQESPGYNQVKIFCYDMLLYTLNKDLLGFLAHDSCILTGMDERQQNTLFHIALNMTQENNFQYLININHQDYQNLISIKPEMTDEQKQQAQLIQDSVVLHLEDTDPSQYLFGCVFDDEIKAGNAGSQMSLNVDGD
ncbi:MAG: DUF2326 domain-containing protein [Shewanellaceae bacterium]|nr:DUF2326 domain-containing protein [Shewanellaceae bacterium]